MEKFEQVFDKIKAIDYADLLSRAAWTFLQAFLGVFLFSYESIIDFAFNGDWTGLWALILTLSIAGVAAGVSALKTFVLALFKK